MSTSSTALSEPQSSEESRGIDHELHSLGSTHLKFKRQISPMLFDLSFNDVLKDGGVEECILRLWKHCQSRSPDSAPRFTVIADVLQADLSMSADEVAVLQNSFQAPDNINFLEFWQVVENNVLIARDLVTISADHAQLQTVRAFRDHVLRLATAEGVLVDTLQEVLAEIQQESDDPDFWVRVGDAFPEEGYVSCHVLAGATHSWLVNDVGDCELEHEELQPGGTYAMSWSNLAGTPLDRLTVCLKLVSNIKDASKAGETGMVASFADALRRALVAVKEQVEIEKGIQAGAPMIYQKQSPDIVDARPLSLQIETASSLNDALAAKLASLGSPRSPISRHEPNSSNSAKTKHGGPSAMSPRQHDKLQLKVDKLKEKVETMKTRLRDMKTKNKGLESQLYDRDKKVAASVDDTRVKLQDELEKARQDALKHTEMHNHAVEVVKAKLALVENQNACLETRLAELTKLHAELKRKDDKPDEDNDEDALVTFLVCAEKTTKKQTVRELQDKVKHLEEYIQHLHDTNNTDAVGAIYEEGDEDDVYVNSRVRQLTRRVHFLHVQCTTLLRVVLEIEKDPKTSAEVQNLAALLRASQDEQNSVNQQLTASLRTETVIKEDVQREVLHLQVRTEELQKEISRLHTLTRALQSDLVSMQQTSSVCCHDHPLSTAAVSDFLPTATVVHKAESARSSGLHSAHDTEMVSVKTRGKAAKGVETVQVCGKSTQGSRITTEKSSKPFSATKKYKTRQQCSKPLTMTFSGGVEVNNMLTTGRREDVIVTRRKGAISPASGKMAVIGEKDDAKE